MTTPMPPERTPTVAVETVAPGDLILLGGHWVEVRAAGVDGPRVVLAVPGRPLLRYERGELVTVLRPLPQQMANPSFWLTFGPAVVTSTLAERLSEHLARWWKERAG